MMLSLPKVNYVLNDDQVPKIWKSLDYKLSTVANIKHFTKEIEKHWTPEIDI